MLLSIMGFKQTFLLQVTLFSTILNLLPTRNFKNMTLLELVGVNMFSRGRCHLLKRHSHLYFHLIVHVSTASADSSYEERTANCVGIVNEATKV